MSVVVGTRSTHVGAIERSELWREMWGITPQMLLPGEPHIAAKSAKPKDLTVN